MTDHMPPLTTSREDFLKDGSDQLFREAIYTWVLERREVERRCWKRLRPYLGLHLVAIRGLDGCRLQQAVEGRDDQGSGSNT